MSVCPHTCQKHQAESVMPASQLVKPLAYIWRLWVQIRPRVECFLKDIISWHKKECRYLPTGNILNGNLTHQNNHLYRCLFRLSPSFCLSTSRIAWPWHGLCRYLAIRCGLNCPYDFLIELRLYCFMEINGVNLILLTSLQMPPTYVCDIMNARRKVMCASYFYRQIIIP